MKLLNFDRVLCISPHPDDVELSMFGTIVKHKDTIFDVICLTICGAKGFDNSYKNDRRGEVKELWDNSKAPNVNFMVSDCEYFEDKTEPGWINYLENEFLQSIDYDCIFIPTYQDSMFEHRFVNKFGYALIRGLPISLIEYHTTSTINTWIPNLNVNISDFYDSKCKAMKHFKSQLDKSYFSDEALRARNTNFQYAKKGIQFVESYSIKELIK